MPRTRARPANEAGRHRFADYIVDVFFVALLAAPFLIFESPASVQDAVVAARAADTRGVIGAAVAAPAVPARANDSTYGPE